MKTFNANCTGNGSVISPVSNTSAQSFFYETSSGQHVQQNFIQTEVRTTNEYTDFEYPETTGMKKRGAHRKK